MNKLLFLQELKERLPAILQDYPVYMAYLFGSYATTTFNEDSDIDIALVIKEPIEKLTIIKIEMRIAALLDKTSKSPFDLRCINNAPLRIKGEIVTHGKLLFCSDEDFRVSYETFIRSRYFDFLPTLRSMREVYFTSIKTGGLVGTA